jgi:hypothetical protein
MKQSEYDRLLREQQAEAQTVNVPGRAIGPSHTESRVSKATRRCPECGMVFQGRHPSDHCPIGVIENVMEEEASSNWGEDLPRAETTIFIPRPEDD